MRRYVLLAVLAGAGAVAVAGGRADAAWAQCPTMLICAQEEAQRIQEESAVFAEKAVQEAPGGKAVVCDLQGRWSVAGGVATGPSRCTRQMYADPADPRNGVTEGTFSIPLVQHQPPGLTVDCAFSLASPDHGQPGDWGRISQPDATYHVHLGGPARYGEGIKDLGVAGNNVNPGEWRDGEHADGTGLAVYVLNAEPASVLVDVDPRDPASTLGGLPAADCSDGEWFVNAAVTLFVA